MHRPDPSRKRNTPDGIGPASGWIVRKCGRTRPEDSEEAPDDSEEAPDGIGPASGWIVRKCGRTRLEDSEEAPSPFSVAELAEASKPKQIIKPGMRINNVVDDLGLSEEQRAVFNLAMNGVSLFYTGAAGTGKSHLLKTLVRHLKAKYPRAVFMTASTGAAACNVGGTTLHSFAGIGLGKGPVEQLYRKTDGASRTRWKNTRVLIIDEISMIDAGLFDKLEALARRHRGTPNKPFGGIQLILCGDFFQLPPVKGSPTFQAACWKKVVHRTVEMRGNFRQARDFAFAETLNELRFGIVSAETRKILNQCLVPFSERTVSLGNPSDTPTAAMHMRPTILYPHRVDVAAKNRIELDKLPGTPHTYLARDVGKPKLCRQLKNCPAPTELVLKRDALVILVKNLDFDRGLVNGAQGAVVGFAKEGPIVQFVNSQMETIKPATWDVELGKDKAARTQIPLMLGYSMSIHKSQGMTLDCAEMMLAKVWENGHAYVALSRVSTAAGLYLVNYAPDSIRANPAVIAFHKQMYDGSGK